MRVTFCLILLAAGFLTGCSSTTVDGRTESEICEIHHIFMHAEEVPSLKEYPQVSQEYMQARAKGFIHSYPFQLPYRKRTKFLVWICDDCVRAEEFWKRQHPGQH